MNKFYLLLVFCCMNIGAFATGYYPSAVSIPSGPATYCTGNVNGAYTVTVTMCGATTTAADTFKAIWYFNNAPLDTITVVPTSAAAIVFTLSAGTDTFNTAGTFSGVNGLYLKIITSNTPPGGCAPTPSSSSPLSITVNPSPVFLGPTSVCSGSSIALSASPSGGVWSVSGSSVSITSTGVITGLAGGTAMVSYTTGSCFDTATFSVATSATLASSGSVCLNVLTDTMKFIPAGGTWTSSNPAVATIGGSNGIMTPIATGTTLVSYTAGACATNAILTVVGLPNPIVGPTSFCPTGSDTLTSTTSPGTWSSGNAFVATVTAGGGIVTAHASGTATISFTETATGCSATSVVSVSSTPAPITGGNAVCLGGTITLANATFGGTWASSVGTIGTIDAATGVVGGVGPGTTTINYIVPGCSFTSKVVTVTPVPGAIAGSTVPICPTSTLVLTNAVAGGTWSAAPVSVASISPTGIVTAITPGTSIITYSIGSGCNVTTVVTVSSGPTAITGPSSVCIGSTITLANTYVGGTWSGGGTLVTLTPSGLTTAVHGDNAGITTITYSAGPGLCSATKLVSVNPNPAPILPTTAVALCAGFSTALSNTSPGGTWTSTGSATIVATGVVTGVIGGTSIISYTLPTGCFATKVITVNALPTITGSSTVCQFNTMTLTATPATPGTGTWSSTMTSIANVSPSPSVSNQGIVLGVSGGTTTITYHDTLGCYNTKVVTVGIQPAVGSITGPAILCAGDTATLHNPIPGGIWSSSPSTVASVGSSTGLVTGILSGAAVGIVYTTPGCIGVAKTMNILAPPAPIIGPSSVCVGTTVTLASATTGGTWSSSDTLRSRVGSSTGVVTGVSMGTVIMTYKLSSLGSCQATKVMTVNPQAPIVGDDTVCAGSVTYLSNIVGGGTWESSNTAIGAIDIITGALTGLANGITYVVYALPTGCTVSVLVSVLPPQPPITGASSVCTGSVTTLTNASAGGIWTSSNVYVGAVGSLSGVLTAGLPDTVTITYTKPHQCISTAVLTVNPLPVPTITLSVAPPPATLSTASSYSAYQWFINGSVIPGATAATVTLTTFYATYSVIVTDANGCKGTAEWKGPVSVQNLDEATVFAYPNPTSGVLHIYAPVAVKALISTIDGRTLMQQNNAKDLDISDLANGIYMLTLYDEQGQKMHTQKLMKN